MAKSHHKHHDRKICQRPNGRLKKGWRYGRNGACVHAKAK